MRILFGTLALTLAALLATGPARGELVVHHPFDDASLPAAYANQGTGGAVHDLNADSGVGHAVASGKIGNAVSLPGAVAGNEGLQQTSVTDVPTPGDSARTVSAWLNANDLPAGTKSVMTLGFNDSSGGATGKKFDFDVQNHLFEVGVGGGRTNGSGQSALAAGNWYLLTVTLPETGNSGASGLLTTSELDFFVDGQAVASSGSTAKEIETLANPDQPATLSVFAVGRGGNGASFQRLDALVDDVAIWDEDLSPDEIQGLFDVGDQLAYDAGVFDSLKQVHDAGSGSAIVGQTLWSYAGNLSGPAGLSGVDLVLDAASGTGVRAVAIPEPASVALLALAVVGWVAVGRSG